MIQTLHKDTPTDLGTWLSHILSLITLLPFFDSESESHILREERKMQKSESKTWGSASALKI
jgi:hypothetical protein